MEFYSNNKAPTGYILVWKAESVEHPKEIKLQRQHYRCSNAWPRFSNTGKNTTK
jgi:hypothetical protein